MAKTTVLGVRVSPDEKAIIMAGFKKLGKTTIGSWMVSRAKDENDTPKDFVQIPLIPDTQRESYAKIKPVAEDVRARVYEALRSGPKTAHRLSLELEKPIYQVSPRITELKHSGWVEDTGIREVNPDTGRNTIVWGRVQSEEQG